MCSPEAFSIAVVGLLFGVPMALRPYQLARFEEILDSIGRKPAGRVEPADWKVTLTRVTGAALSVAGTVAAASCLL